jgi:hypothetical protein
MSVPPKGEELPKKGGKLPSSRTRREQAREFAQAIAEALKEELARGATIKTIMGWTGAGERTVKEWLAGSNAPRAFQLECLFRSSEAVYQRIMLRTGRQPVVTNRLAEIRLAPTRTFGSVERSGRPPSPNRSDSFRARRVVRALAVPRGHLLDENAQALPNKAPEPNPLRTLPIRLALSTASVQTRHRSLCGQRAEATGSVMLTSAQLPMICIVRSLDLVSLERLGGR